VGSRAVTEPEGYMVQYASLWKYAREERATARESAREEGGKSERERESQREQERERHGRLGGHLVGSRAVTEPEGYMVFCVRRW